MRRYLQALCCWIALGFCVIASADERIVSYQTDVLVQTNGELLITETLLVKAEQLAIKRGIYRDFPTRYTLQNGQSYHTPIHILSVTRNGQPEAHHSVQRENGLRLYIGDKDTLLSIGQHRYEIRYTTDRQIQFLPTRDELYFNVIGHGFNFPIDQANATVSLPSAAQILEYTAFTGRQGSRDSNVTFAQNYPFEISATATRPLLPYEGMTLVVAWPKGIVQPPDSRQQLSWWWQDFYPAVLAAVFAFLVVIYLWIRWLQVGRDPKSGTIIPLFTPPKGLSPAACQYILEHKLHPAALTAAITHMAVKGYLAIQETNQSGIYTLIRTGKSAELSPGEQALANHLFTITDTLTIGRQHNPVMVGANKAFKAKLMHEYGKQNFRHNLGSFISACLLALVGFITLILLTNNLDAAGMGIFAAGLGAAMVSGIRFFFARRTRLSVWQQVLAGLGNLIPFAILLLILNASVVDTLSFNTQAIVIYCLSCGALLALFQWLLKAPTVLGRQLMDQIEGFKLYLSVAEQDLLNFQHPPEKTPELFERYLPYAIALGVENAWGEKFTQLLSKTQNTPESSTLHWYQGRGRLDYNRLSSSLSSGLNSAIAAAATPPSSSGSSGFSGGSSGGGGGGGGGGGW